jgi:hypothetical protein
MEPRRTLTIHLDLHWRAVAAACCIVALLVLALNVSSAQENGARSVNDPEVPVAAGAAASSPEGRYVTAAGGGTGSVYVTEGYFYPDEALTACGPGYHMASLWEILDTSNWTYAYDHPAAHVQDDSGRGPPSHWSGWIRTGYWSNEDPAAPTAGMANCLAWTSHNEYGYGTTVRLSSRWETEPGEIMTWEAALGRCDDAASVWCVRD